MLNARTSCSTTLVANLKVIRIFLGAVLVGALVGYWWSHRNSYPDPTVLRGSTMGTYFAVTYYPQQDTPEPTVIRAQLAEDLDKVNRQMSTYIPDSEISRFNLHHGTEPQKISPWFAEVLGFALGLAARTGGRYDPTVGPLVNLWGFGPDGPTREPSQGDVIDAQAAVGYLKVRLTEEGVSKTHPRVYLDLSSVAKGFGVDILARRLDKLAINNYLVEIGGELRSRGRHSDGSEWQVGIEEPRAERTVHRMISLSDQAIATSGNYRHYWQNDDGDRYSHTIDPLTGRPVTSNLLSVTVLANTCMQADALATALMTMGVVKARSYAEAEDLSVMFIRAGDDGLQTEMTVAFRESIRGREL